jgi:hypothetical protein
MTNRNVLPVAPLVKQKDYRTAIASIIRSVQLEHHQTDIEMAEVIGCSARTIANARNEENDLSPLSIARIGQRYGPATIDPYMALLGGRAVATAPDDSDVLPALTVVICDIARARSRTSPGGRAETPSELLGMLPDVDEALDRLSAFKAHILSVKLRSVA